MERNWRDVVRWSTFCGWRVCYKSTLCGWSEATIRLLLGELFVLDMYFFANAIPLRNTCMALES